nr:hypothetical protein [Tanacetum cinerariifolium]
MPHHRDHLTMTPPLRLSHPCHPHHHLPAVTTTKATIRIQATSTSSPPRQPPPSANAISTPPRPTKGALVFSGTKKGCVGCLIQPIKVRLALLHHGCVWSCCTTASRVRLDSLYNHKGAFGLAETPQGCVWVSRNTTRVCLG